MSNKAIIFLEGHGEMSRDLFTSLDVSNYQMYIEIQLHFYVKKGLQ